MLEKHIRDIIEQILIEIWFQCPLSTWLMGPTPRLRGLKGTLIWQLSICLWILWSLPTAATSSVQCGFEQIKLRLNFLYFPALTYVLWQALNQFYAIIDFFLNGHKPFRLLPFFPLSFSALSHRMLDIQPAGRISPVSCDFHGSYRFVPFLQHHNWQR